MLPINTDDTGTWVGSTMVVPTPDQRTWTSGERLTTRWHTLTSAMVHLTRSTHDPDGPARH